MLVINDSPLTAIGENLHAVGQSAVESFERLTNLVIPGRRFVVAGSGWCGRGVARYLRALGGQVAVAEIDEIKSFEAALDGYVVADLASSCLAEQSVSRMPLDDGLESFAMADGRPPALGPPGWSPRSRCRTCRRTSPRGWMREGDGPRGWRRSLSR